MNGVFSHGFAHYLSYGATDQQTARELVGYYSGLLVPGTVAAFQREGTGGFVLTLSATPEAPEYAIDPRFPLFQQALSRPKKSHQSLAALLGVPELIRSSTPTPTDFSDEVVQTIAANWAEFNGTYRASAGSKFAKYARRLGRDVRPQNAQSPTYVLPPYLIAAGSSDPWWQVSSRLYTATEQAVEDSSRCVRVLGATDVGALASLLDDLPEARAAIWVSGLEELTSPPDVLAQYGSTIQSAAASGVSLFALYGGFFSVLLRGVGLVGASHGIGYGEYRNWIELPESGPPPARYYLPQLHRYIQPDEAARLYFADRRLASCPCAECHNDPPVGLDYHSLMKHSVRCRAAEVDAWAGLGPADAADRLEAETNEFVQTLHAADLPDVAITRIERQSLPLRTWIDALRRI